MGTATQNARSQWPRPSRGTVVTATDQNRPPAVVVGLCAHGLAIVRALARAGVEVHALEANLGLPATRTRYARVHHVDDINGPGLIASLISARARIACTRPPVLLLTNDNMVRQVAEHWPRLDALYVLSWSHCRQEIATLLSKSSHAEYSARAGLRYPQTRLIRARTDVPKVLGALALPAILKPAKPLSRFKVMLLDSATALTAAVENFASDLPFIVQQWIPGDDTRISFCALYLDHGRVLARFDGHKLRSRPMGHTTIAEPRADEAVFQDTLKFFGVSSLSGPVSLELKRDEMGDRWVIEPTVGRTDFWLDCCIANGVNLPLLEYCHQAGLPPPAAQPRATVVWLNTERDPLSVLWFVKHLLVSFPRIRTATFPYLDAGDIRPFFASWLSATRAFGRRLVRKIVRTLVPTAPPTSP